MALPTPIADTLFDYKETLAKRKKYIKNEFQAYGLEIAEALGDWDKRSIYIRLAKTIDRRLLASALSFVKDQSRHSVKSPPRLFMWKLKQLRTKD